MARRGLSGSASWMRAVPMLARSNSSTQRPNTLMQLSRSSVCQHHLATHGRTIHWHFPEVDQMSARATNSGRSWRTGDRQCVTRFGPSRNCGCSCPKVKVLSRLRTHTEPETTSASTIRPQPHLRGFFLPLAGAITDEPASTLRQDKLHPVLSPNLEQARDIGGW
jgi:hypothetical protein